MVAASMLITYETNFRSMLSLTNTIMPPLTDVRLVVYFQRCLGAFAQFCFKFLIWISVYFTIVNIIEHDWLFTAVGHVQSTDVGPLLLNCTIILITHRSLRGSPLQFRRADSRCPADSACSGF